MMNLYDLGKAIMEIRDAADILEVKGAKNAGLVSLIFQRCNDIIIELNKIVQSKKEETNEDPQNQVGEDDGQVDS